MNFNQYYFNEKNLTEINWLKSRFFGNAVRALVGSGKRKVNPRDFKKFTQLTPAGFSEIFSIFSNRYDNRKNLKHHIKNLYTALISPKDTVGLFLYKDEKGQDKEIEVSDPKQIKAASYYETNKGGRIMLVDISDAAENGRDRYFIGLDGNALKFWNAPLKKGGVGRDFRTWLAAQAAATYKPSQASISPEFPGKGEEKPTAAAQNLLKFKYNVPEDQYHKMVPKAGAQLHLAPTGTESISFSLLDLFSEEVLKEKERAITKVDDQWYLVRKFKNGWQVRMDNPVSKFTDKDYAVDNKGQKDEALQKDLDSLRGKQKEDSKRESQMKEQGELFKDLKDELDANKPPAKVKPSEKTKSGWRFILKNGGIIFVYETTDGKYMLGFDDKAKKTVDTKDLVRKYHLEIAKEYPEVESPE